MNARCETCRFWRGSEIDNWSGECRRHAPVETVQRFKDVFDGVWPRVVRSAWCGDFERLPPTPEELHAERAKEQAEEEKFLKEVFP